MTALREFGHEVIYLNFLSISTLQKKYWVAFGSKYSPVFGQQKQACAQLDHL